MNKTKEPEPESEPNLSTKISQKLSEDTETSQTSYPHNRITWITLVNHGYVSYTKNFLRNVQERRIPFILHVFCTDEMAYQELQNEPGCVCFSTDFLQLSLSTNMTNWQEYEYKKITFAKLDIIQYCLQYANNPIGYIDTDIVLFHDPTPYFVEEMNNHPNISIFSQCDEGGTRCSDCYNCKNFCTGVTVYRNDPELCFIFDYDEEEVESWSSDQAFLNHTCELYDVPTMTLPKSLLTNGCYFPELQESKIDIPDTCCLLHFNYMIGHRKKECMKLQNMWLLSEPTVPVKPPLSNEDT